MRNDKENRINAELKRLRKYFDAVDENQRAMAEPLLQNAAFMAITLQDLQLVINEEGATDEYCNGQHQYGEKPSANLQAYNATIKNYTGVVKALAQLLPKESQAGSGKLAGFIEAMNK